MRRASYSRFMVALALVSAMAAGVALAKTDFTLGGRAEATFGVEVGS